MEENNCLSLQNCELITIDDSAARIREDAVACRKNDTGTFELTVAITDIAQLLNAYPSTDPRNTLRKIHRSYREDFSLDEGATKPAIVATGLLNADGAPISFSVEKRNVVTQRNFTNTEVDRLLKKPEKDDLIAPLAELANKLREQRIGKPLQDGYNPILLVAEVVIWMNKKIAAVLGKGGFPAIYRERSGDNTVMYHRQYAAGKDMETPCSSPLRNIIDMVNQAIILAVLSGQNEIPYTTEAIANCVQAANKRKVSAPPKPGTILKKLANPEEQTQVMLILDDLIKQFGITWPRRKDKKSDSQYLHILTDQNNRLFASPPDYIIRGNGRTGFTGYCKIKLASNATDVCVVITVKTDCAFMERDQAKQALAQKLLELIKTRRTDQISID